MDIVEPVVTIVTEKDPLKRIELCGRICYKSEDKIKEGSARKFVEARIKPDNGGNIHGSILEHSRIKVSEKHMLERLDKEGGLQNIPYGFEARIRAYTRWTSEDEAIPETYYTVNVRDFLWLGGSLDEVSVAENADDYMTAIFTCDRGIWFELNRHREMSKTNEDAYDDRIEDEFSYSQESTRYCNYQKRGLSFVVPRWFKWANGRMDSLVKEDIDKFNVWKRSCEQAEENYNELIGMELKPQEARDVLTNSLKTELVMTGTMEQWRRLLQLRTDKAAHPQVRYLMKLLTLDPNFPEELK